MTSELIELLHDVRFRLENMGATAETDAGLVDRIMKNVDILRARAVPDVPELVRYDLACDFDGKYAAHIVEVELGEYVLYSQAAEMMAAKDETIELLSQHSHDLNIELQEVYERAEAAESELAQIKAQEPVGHFVKTGNDYYQEIDGDDDGIPLYAAPVDQTEEIERLLEALREVHTMIEHDRTGKFKIVQNVINASLSGKETS